MRVAAGFCLLAGVLVGGCLDQRCFEQADCPSPKICGPTGHCQYECLVRSDCASGFTCVDRVCRPSSTGPITCPADMVAVADNFCLDRYEASRDDASATGAGSDGTVARSRAGVLPWLVADNAAAAAACQAAGKRLCEATEWQLACSGPDRTVYAYGNSYQPATCNGIDTFGRSDFHLMPTGSFAGCTNEWGAYDLNGNMWEQVAGGSDQTVRGGAYNCSDSATFHRCDYVPGSWAPTARGFRCCLTPVAATDAGRADRAPADGAVDASAEGGCVGEAGADVDPIAVDSGTGDSAAPVRRLPDAAITDGRAADATAIDAGAGCPAEMVPVGASCVDRYEASRSDSTAVNAGASSTATTRAGVLPWFPVTKAQARAGCASMGKRLCRPDEWFMACGGPTPTVYGYGDSYQPTTCNGIDTYCNCAANACASLAVCPYPHCYNQPSTSESGGPCGASFHLMPTGSFAGCTSGYGVFDVNGNVWEIVDSSDSLEHFRGGAFNCSDSVLFHRCDYDATWGPSARGFRCCADRVP